MSSKQAEQNVDAAAAAAIQMARQAMAAAEARRRTLLEAEGDVQRAHAALADAQARAEELREKPEERAAREAAEAAVADSRRRAEELQREKLPAAREAIETALTALAEAVETTLALHRALAIVEGQELQIPAAAGRYAASRGILTRRVQWRMWNAGLKDIGLPMASARANEPLSAVFPA